eukprot:scaffold5087_cov430-Prasinococcus_capsulatus_cf.AAC.2
MPRTQIDVVIQVLQADGGQQCAALNAAMIAIIDAGTAPSPSCAARLCVLPLAACYEDIAGYLEATPILDPNYLELSHSMELLWICQLGNQEGAVLGCQVALNPNQDDSLAMVQMDAPRVSADNFEAVLQLAISGCKAIHKVLRDAVMDHCAKALTASGTIS